MTFYLDSGSLRSRIENLVTTITLDMFYVLFGLNMFSWLGFGTVEVLPDHGLSDVSSDIHDTFVLYTVM